MQPFGTLVGNFLHAISISYFLAHQPHPTNTPVPTVENFLLGRNSRDCSTLHCDAIIHTLTTIGFQPWEATTVWCFFSLLDTFTLGYFPQPKDILLRSPYLLVIFNSLFIVNQPLYEKFPFHISLRYLSTDWIRLIHSKANTWVYFQDGRVGLELTSSHENTKSQVTAEQPSAKKTDIYLKRYSTSRDKEDSGRGTYSIQSNPIPAGWVAHKQENNCITEILPQVWEFWVPHQASQSRGLASRWGAPEH